MNNLDIKNKNKIKTKEINILIIEDDILINKMINRLIKNRNKYLCNIYSAYSYDEAKYILLSNQKESIFFDLIILD